MRVVLDTNLVVRAARPGHNLGRAILSEALSDRHTLILSNALYFEIYKVLFYDNVRRMHGLDDAKILEFLDALAEGCLTVSTNPLGPGPLVAADPRDDHVLLTAIAGNADALGTNNRHHQGRSPGLRVRDGALSQRAGRGPGQGHRHRSQVHPGRGLRQAGGGEEPGGVPRRGRHRGQAARREELRGRGVDGFLRLLFAGFDRQRRGGDQARRAAASWPRGARSSRSARTRRGS